MQLESALTYVGHATVLIELAGVRLLTDPLLSAGILHVRRRIPVPVIEDLRPLDAILISHAHHDHLDRDSLRLLARECPVIVPRGCASLVRRMGAFEVTELEVGDGLPIGEVIVEGFHAAHDGRRYPFSRPLAALGYVLEGPLHIYFAGDTDLFPGMSALAGLVDVALVPIWGWGPRIPPGHLDPARAAEAVARIQPRLAVPIHWGTLRARGAQRGLDRSHPRRRLLRRSAAPLQPPQSGFSCLASGSGSDMAWPEPGIRRDNARALRSQVPRSSQAVWEPPPSRRDPVVLLREQEVKRVPELMPIRHERMIESPFTFFRGASPY